MSLESEGTLALVRKLYSSIIRHDGIIVCISSSMGHMILELNDLRAFPSRYVSTGNPLYLTTVSPLQTPRSFGVVKRCDGLTRRVTLRHFLSVPPERPRR